MRGYGRGYYGEEQMTPSAPRRSSGWVKIALVVGVGAVVWYMWPRKSKLIAPGELPLQPPQQPPLPQLPLPQLPQPSQGPPLLPAPSEQVSLAPLPPLIPGAEPLPPLSQPQLTQEALARGYPSQQAYEDAVVATARQLQETGARVTLAPHLQHLAPRVGP